VVFAWEAGLPLLLAAGFRLPPNNRCHSEEDFLCLEAARRRVGLVLLLVDRLRL
jgi:hypothetical protein